MYNLTSNTNNLKTLHTWHLCNFSIFTKKLCEFLEEIELNHVNYIHQFSFPVNHDNIQVLRVRNRFLLRMGEPQGSVRVPEDSPFISFSCVICERNIRKRTRNQLWIFRENSRFDPEKIQLAQNSKCQFIPSHWRQRARSVFQDDN